MELVDLGDGKGPRKIPYVLTRDQYYKGMGYWQAQKRRKGWARQCAAAEERLRGVSLRTADAAAWNAYVAVVTDVQEVMWRNRLRKCWAQERFRAYRLKRKTLDRFYARVIGRATRQPEDVRQRLLGRPVRIAFGGAKFAATGKGEMAVPTDASFKSAQRVLNGRVDIVNEFRSTVVCNRCKQRTCNVIKKANDGSIQSVRGLRWCQNQDCRPTRMLNRDKNAAWNIYDIFRAGQNRPDCFKSQTGETIPEAHVLRKPGHRLRRKRQRQGEQIQPASKKYAKESS